MRESDDHVLSIVPCVMMPHACPAIPVLILISVILVPSSTSSSAGRHHQISLNSSNLTPSPPQNQHPLHELSGCRAARHQRRHDREVSSEPVSIPSAPAYFVYAPAIKRRVVESHPPPPPPFRLSRRPISRALLASDAPWLLVGVFSLLLLHFCSSGRHARLVDTPVGPPGTFSLQDTPWSARVSSARPRIVAALTTLRFLIYTSQQCPDAIAFASASNLCSYSHPHCSTLCATLPGVFHGGSQVSCQRHFSLSHCNPPSRRISRARPAILRSIRICLLVYSCEATQLYSFRFRNVMVTHDVTHHE